MKLNLFEKQGQPVWRQTENSAASAIKVGRVLTEREPVTCSPLAFANQSSDVTARALCLNESVLKIFSELCRYPIKARLNIIAFFSHDFPLAIYRHRFFILLALLFLVLPGLIAGAWTYHDREAVYSVLDASEVRAIERMYDPSPTNFGRERATETDLSMFGFYIQNNIGVAFRCFAGGMLIGIGSLLLLLFNGLHIGSIAGHLTRLDYIDTFYPFVVGHGAFELTALVFSGAAGLRLGYALIQPGRYSRVNSLRQAGRDVRPMIYGIVFMLTVAAFLEAFWSASSTMSAEIKYSVGAVLWFMVLSYAFSGRRHATR